MVESDIWCFGSFHKLVLVYIRDIFPNYRGDAGKTTCAIECVLPEVSLV